MQTPQWQLAQQRGGAVNQPAPPPAAPAVTRVLSPAAAAAAAKALADMPPPEVGLYFKIGIASSTGASNGAAATGIAVVGEQGLSSSPAVPAIVAALKALLSQVSVQSNIRKV